MKKTVFILVILFSISCASQKQIVKDLSSSSDSNYILANIYKTLYNSHSLYKNSFYLRAYLMSDSKSTPENYSEGTDEVASSILISVKPDGDYYTTSKLYKIEMLYNPKIIEIKETGYPEFIVAIESGSPSNRSTQRHTLKAE